MSRMGRTRRVKELYLCLVSTLAAVCCCLYELDLHKCTGAYTAMPGMPTILLLDHLKQDDARTRCVKEFLHSQLEAERSDPVEQHAPLCRVLGLSVGELGSASVGVDVGESVGHRREESCLRVRVRVTARVREYEYSNCAVCHRREKRPSAGLSQRWDASIG